jgi:T-complex protein 1 subunit delta
LDLKDIMVVTKMGGTVDDSQMVDGMVFDQKACKSAGGPTRMENAKIGLIQFHISPPKTDLENNVIISDYAQVRNGVGSECARLSYWIPA